ncbi:MAG: AI-2E family transporter [Acidimicrobiia bacterium]|nr:AI-2E family transporter [Acidimicrobiia bacterium]
MLGLDSKTFRIAWTVCFTAALLFGLYVIRRTLLVLVCAILLAYLLAPVVSLLERFPVRRVPRNVSLVIVYIVLLSAVVGIGAAMGELVLDDAMNLTRDMPRYLESGEPFLPEVLAPYEEPLRQWMKEALAPEAGQVVPLLQRTGRQLATVAGNTLLVVLVPIFSFFLLKDSATIRELALQQIDNAETRRLAENIVDDVHIMLIQYVRAMVLLSLCTFLVYWLFLASVGVPNSAALASLAGVLEFVPAAGPLAASLTILLIAGFAGFPHLLWVVAFLIIYRLILDYAILPHIMSAGVALHPVIVIVAILAGEQMGGIAGMFLSIPIIATMRVVYVCYRRARHAV